MELWISAKLISSNLKSYYKTDQVTITIQDGEDSGQTVQHVHFHIIPVIRNNNKILSFEKKNGERTLDNNSKDKRSLDEMAEEANNYKKSFFFP